MFGKYYCVFMLTMLSYFCQKMGTDKQEKYNLSFVLYLEKGIKND